ncbi:MAG: hypothetical protein SGCHY_005248, partial [Lobulomycetales sp.]
MSKRAESQNHLFALQMFEAVGDDVGGAASSSNSAATACDQQPGLGQPAPSWENISGLMANFIATFPQFVQQQMTKNQQDTVAVDPLQAAINNSFNILGQQSSAAQQPKMDLFDLSTPAIQHNQAQNNSLFSWTNEDEHSLLQLQQPPSNPQPSFVELLRDVNPNESTFNDPILSDVCLFNNPDFLLGDVLVPEPEFKEEIKGSSRKAFPSTKPVAVRSVATTQAQDTPTKEHHKIDK